MKTPRSVRFWILPAVLGQLGLATLALAGPPELDPETLMSVRRSLDGASKARVITEGDPLEVRNPEVNRYHLTFAWAKAGESAGQLSWSDISKVQVRRNGAGRGALVGGVTVGAIGLVIGLASASECSDRAFDIEVFCGASESDVAIATIAGFAIGGVLGAGIGAATGYWSTVYEAPDSSPDVSFFVPPGGGVGLAVRLVPGYR